MAWHGIYVLDVPDRSFVGWIYLIIRWLEVLFLLQSMVSWLFFHI